MANPLISINPDVISDNMRRYSTAAVTSSRQYQRNTPNLPSTLEEYCRASEAMNRPRVNLSKRDELQNWVNQFDVDAVYKKESRSIIMQLNKSIAQLNNVQLDLVDDNLFDYEIYRENLNDLVQIRKKLDDIEIWLSSATCVFTINQNLKYIGDEIFQITNTVNEIKNRFSSLSDIIAYNIENANTFDADTRIVENIILGY